MKKTILMCTVLLMLGCFPGEAVKAWAGPDLPRLAGVYKCAEADLILANHPKSPTEYIGQIVFRDLRILPLRIGCDTVKGCHGVIYPGTLAEQTTVELRLQSDKLTFRYYDGPTLVMDREKAN